MAIVRALALVRFFIIELDKFIFRFCSRGAFLVLRCCNYFLRYAISVQREQALENFLFGQIGRKTVRLRDGGIEFRVCVCKPSGALVVKIR